MNLKQQTVVPCFLMMGVLILGCNIFAVPAAPTATNMPPTETQLPAAPSAPTAMPTVVPTDTAAITLLPPSPNGTGYPVHFR